jgi:hypothetical protein
VHSFYWLSNQGRFDGKALAPRALVKGLLRRDPVEQQPQPAGRVRSAAGSR